MDHPVMRQIFPAIRNKAPGMSEIDDKKSCEAQYIQFIDPVLFRYVVYRRA